MSVSPFIPLYFLQKLSYYMAMNTTKETTPLSKATNLERAFRTADRYVNRALAFSSLERRVKPCWVVFLGDDERYWVVKMRYTDALLEAGYELA